MRRHVNLAVALLLHAYVPGRSGECLAAIDPAGAPRESRELATGWRFQIDTHDLGAKDRWFDPGHDRSAWAQVEVPRAWDTFDESLRGFEGIGWYAVTLDGSWARQGSLQRLAFGRVMYHTRGWPNGGFLGQHTPR